MSTNLPTPRYEPGQQVGMADIVLKVQDENRFDFAMRADNHGLQETGRIRYRTAVDWNNPTGGGDSSRPRGKSVVSVKAGLRTLPTMEGSMKDTKRRLADFFFCSRGRSR